MQSSLRGITEPGVESRTPVETRLGSPGNMKTSSKLSSTAQRRQPQAPAAASSAAQHVGSTHGLELTSIPFLNATPQPLPVLFQPDSALKASIAAISADALASGSTSASAPVPLSPSRELGVNLPNSKAGLSALEAVQYYRSKCNELGQPPQPSVQNALVQNFVHAELALKLTQGDPETEMSAAAHASDKLRIVPTEWTFSQLNLSGRACYPLLDTIRWIAPRTTRISMLNCGIDNATVRYLARILSSFPRLVLLDLSENPRITEVSALAQVAENHNALASVQLENTGLAIAIHNKEASALQQDSAEFLRNIKPIAANQPLAWSLSPRLTELTSLRALEHANESQAIPSTPAVGTQSIVEHAITKALDAQSSDNLVSRIIANEDSTSVEPAGLAIRDEFGSEAIPSGLDASVAPTEEVQTSSQPALPTPQPAPFRVPSYYMMLARHNPILSEITRPSLSAQSSTWAGLQDAYQAAPEGNPETAPVNSSSAELKIASVAPQQRPTRLAKPRSYGLKGQTFKPLDEMPELCVVPQSSFSTTEPFTKSPLKSSTPNSGVGIVFHNSHGETKIFGRNLNMEHSSQQTQPNPLFVVAPAPVGTHPGTTARLIEARRKRYPKPKVMSNKAATKNVIAEVIKTEKEPSEAGAIPGDIVSPVAATEYSSDNLEVHPPNAENVSEDCTASPDPLAPSAQTQVADIISSESQQDGDPAVVAAPESAQAYVADIAEEEEADDCVDVWVTQETAKPTDVQFDSHEDNLPHFEPKETSGELAEHLVTTTLEHTLPALPPPTTASPEDVEGDAAMPERSLQIDTREDRSPRARVRRALHPPNNRKGLRPSPSKVSTTPKKPRKKKSSTTGKVPQDAQQSGDDAPSHGEEEAFPRTTLDVVQSLPQLDPILPNVPQSGAEQPLTDTESTHEDEHKADEPKSPAGSQAEAPDSASTKLQPAKEERSVLKHLPGFQATRETALEKFATSKGEEEAAKEASASAAALILEDIQAEHRRRSELEANLESVLKLEKLRAKEMLEQEYLSFVEQCCIAERDILAWGDTVHANMRQVYYEVARRLRGSAAALDPLLQEVGTNEKTSNLMTPMMFTVFIQRLSEQGRAARAYEYASYALNNRFENHATLAAQRAGALALIGNASGAFQVCAELLADLSISRLERGRLYALAAEVKMTAMWSGFFGAGMTAKGSNPKHKASQRARTRATAEESARLMAAAYEITRCLSHASAAACLYRIAGREEDVQVWAMRVLKEAASLLPLTFQSVQVVPDRILYPVVSPAKPVTGSDPSSQSMPFARPLCLVSIGPDTASYSKYGAFGAGTSTPSFQSPTHASESGASHPTDTNLNPSLYTSLPSIIPKGLAISMEDYMLAQAYRRRRSDPNSAVFRRRAARTRAKHKAHRTGEQRSPLESDLELSDEYHTLDSGSGSSSDSERYAGYESEPDATDREDPVSMKPHQDSPTRVMRRNTLVASGISHSLPKHTHHSSLPSISASDLVRSSEKSAARARRRRRLLQEQAAFRRVEYQRAFALAAAPSIIAATPGVILFDEYRIYACVAEALVALGHFAEAATYYQLALAKSGINHGAMAQFARRLDCLDASGMLKGNLRRILPFALGLSSSAIAVPFNTQALAGPALGRGWRPLVILRHLLHRVGKVVMFTGHAIDRPSDSSVAKRFPVFPPLPALERLVSAAIAEALDRLQPTVGYCFVSSGSDILFAEHMLRRGAELHVVMPFRSTDFFLSSVDYGSPLLTRWRLRCVRILNNPYVTVHWTTTEAFLDDRTLFDFAQEVMRGLALLRVADLGRASDVCLLAVLDRDRVGSHTHRFVESWRKRNKVTTIIDLRHLRQLCGVSQAARSAEDAHEAFYAPEFKNTVFGNHDPSRFKISLYDAAHGLTKLPLSHIELLSQLNTMHSFNLAERYLAQRRAALEASMYYHEKRIWRPAGGSSSTFGGYLSSPNGTANAVNEGADLIASMTKATGGGGSRVTGIITYNHTFDATRSSSDMTAGNKRRASVIGTGLSLGDARRTSTVKQRRSSVAGVESDVNSVKRIATEKLSQDDGVMGGDNTMTIESAITSEMPLDQIEEEVSDFEETAPDQTRSPRSSTRTGRRQSIIAKVVSADLDQVQIQENHCGLNTKGDQEAPSQARHERNTFVTRRRNSLADFGLPAIGSALPTLLPLNDGLESSPSRENREGSSRMTSSSHQASPHVGSQPSVPSNPHSPAYKSVAPTLLAAAAIVKSARAVVGSRGARTNLGPVSQSQSTLTPYQVSMTEIPPELIPATQSAPPASTSANLSLNPTGATQASPPSLLPPLESAQENVSRPNSAATNVPSTTTLEREPKLDKFALFNSLVSKTEAEVLREIPKLSDPSVSPGGRRASQVSALSPEGSGHPSSTLEELQQQSAAAARAKLRNLGLVSVAQHYAARLARVVRYMVFADVTNMSHMRERYMPYFYNTFFSLLLLTIRITKCRPGYANTWSTGLYFVFEDPISAARFATTLLDLFSHVDWSSFGLPKSTTTRLGIHAGPVFPGYNPVEDTLCVYGGHVCRAARIYAVAPRRAALCSLEFAASLRDALDGLPKSQRDASVDFVLEYMGELPMAKNYGKAFLYRLQLRYELALNIEVADIVRASERELKLRAQRLHEEQERALRKHEEALAQIAKEQEILERAKENIDKARDAALNEMRRQKNLEALEALDGFLSGPIKASTQAAKPTSSVAEITITSTVTIGEDLTATRDVIPQPQSTVQETSPKPPSTSESEQIQDVAEIRRRRFSLALEMAGISLALPPAPPQSAERTQEETQTRSDSLESSSTQTTDGVSTVQVARLETEDDGADTGVTEEDTGITASTKMHSADSPDGSRIDVGKVTADLMPVPQVEQVRTASESEELVIRRTGDDDEGGTSSSQNHQQTVLRSVNEKHAPPSVPPTPKSIALPAAPSGLMSALPTPTNILELNAAAVRRKSVVDASSPDALPGLRQGIPLATTPLATSSLAPEVLALAELNSPGSRPAFDPIAKPLSLRLDSTDNEAGDILMPIPSIYGSGGGRRLSLPSAFLRQPDGLRTPLFSPVATPAPEDNAALRSDEFTLPSELGTSVLALRAVQASAAAAEARATAAGGPDELSLNVEQAPSAPLDIQTTTKDVRRILRVARAKRANASIPFGGQTIGRSVSVLSDTGPNTLQDVEDSFRSGFSMVDHTPASAAPPPPMKAGGRRGSFVVDTGDTAGGLLPSTGSTSATKPTLAPGGDMNDPENLKQMSSTVSTEQRLSIISDGKLAGSVTASAQLSSTDSSASSHSSQVSVKPGQHRSPLSAQQLQRQTAADQLLLGVDSHATEAVQSLPLTSRGFNRPVVFAPRTSDLPIPTHGVNASHKPGVLLSTRLAPLKLQSRVHSLNLGESSDSSQSAPRRRRRRSSKQASGDTRPSPQLTPESSFIGGSSDRAATETLDVADQTSPDMASNEGDLYSTFSERSIVPSGTFDPSQGHLHNPHHLSSQPLAEIVEAPSPLPEMATGEDLTVGREIPDRRMTRSIELTQIAELAVLQLPELQVDDLNPTPTNHTQGFSAPSSPRGTRFTFREDEITSSQPALPAPLAKAKWLPRPFISAAAPPEFREGPISGQSALYYDESSASERELLSEAAASAEEQEVNGQPRSQQAVSPSNRSVVATSHRSHSRRSRAFSGGSKQGELSTSESESEVESGLNSTRRSRRSMRLKIQHAATPASAERARRQASTSSASHNANEESVEPARDEAISNPQHSLTLSLTGADPLFTSQISFPSSRRTRVLEVAADDLTLDDGSFRVGGAEGMSGRPRRGSRKLETPQSHLISASSDSVEDGRKSRLQSQQGDVVLQSTSSSNSRLGHVHSSATSPRHSMYPVGAQPPPHGTTTFGSNIISRVPSSMSVLPLVPRPAVEANAEEAPSMELIDPSLRDAEHNDLTVLVAGMTAQPPYRAPRPRYGPPAPLGHQAPTPSYSTAGTNSSKMDITSHLYPLEDSDDQLLSNKPSNVLELLATPTPASSTANQTLSTNIAASRPAVKPRHHQRHRSLVDPNHGRNSRKGSHDETSTADKDAILGGESDIRTHHDDADSPVRSHSEIPTSDHGSVTAPADDVNVPSSELPVEPSFLSKIARHPLQLKLTDESTTAEEGTSTGPEDVSSHPKRRRPRKRIRHNAKTESDNISIRRASTMSIESSGYDSQSQKDESSDTEIDPESEAWNIIHAQLAVLRFDINQASEEELEKLTLLVSEAGEGDDGPLECTEETIAQSDLNMLVVYLRQLLDAGFAPTLTTPEERVKSVVIRRAAVQAQRAKLQHVRQQQSDKEPPEQLTSNPQHHSQSSTSTTTRRYSVSGVAGTQNRSERRGSKGGIGGDLVAAQAASTASKTAHATVKEEDDSQSRTAAAEAAAALAALSEEAHPNEGPSLEMPTFEELHPALRHLNPESEAHRKAAIHFLRTRRWQWGNDPNLVIALVDALLLQGHVNGAMLALRRALAADSPWCMNIRLLFARAISLTQGRNTSKAETYVQELLERLNLHAPLRTEVEADEGTTVFGESHSTSTSGAVVVASAVAEQQLSLINNQMNHQSQSAQDDKTQGTAVTSVLNTLRGALPQVAPTQRSGAVDASPPEESSIVPVPLSDLRLDTTHAGRPPTVGHPSAGPKPGSSSPNVKPLLPPAPQSPLIAERGTLRRLPSLSLNTGEEKKTASPTKSPSDAVEHALPPSTSSSTAAPATVAPSNVSQPAPSSSMTLMQRWIPEKLTLERIETHKKVLCRRFWHETKDIVLVTRILTLAGKLRRERYERHAPLQQRTERAIAAHESALFYQKAFFLSGTSSTAISSAIMFVAAHHLAHAKVMADQAIRAVAHELLSLNQRISEKNTSEPPGTRLLTARPEHYGLYAAMGKAHLILGRIPEAIRWFNFALALMDVLPRSVLVAPMAQTYKTLKMLLKLRLRIPSNIMERFAAALGNPLVFLSHHFHPPPVPTSAQLRAQGIDPALVLPEAAARAFAASDALGLALIQRLQRMLPQLEAAGAVTDAINRARNEHSSEGTETALAPSEERRYAWRMAVCAAVALAWGPGSPSVFPFVALPPELYNVKMGEAIRLGLTAFLRVPRLVLGHGGSHFDPAYCFNLLLVTYASNLLGPDGALAASINAAAARGDFTANAIPFLLHEAIQVLPGRVKINAGSFLLAAAHRVWKEACAATIRQRAWSDVYLPVLASAGKPASAYTVVAAAIELLKRAGLAEQLISQAQDVLREISARARHIAEIIAKSSVEAASAKSAAILAVAGLTLSAAATANSIRGWASFPLTPAATATLEQLDRAIMQLRDQCSPDHDVEPLQYSPTNSAQSRRNSSASITTSTGDGSLSLGRMSSVSQATEAVPPVKHVGGRRRAGSKVFFPAPSTSLATDDGDRTEGVAAPPEFQRGASSMSYHSPRGKSITPAVAGSTPTSVHTPSRHFGGTSSPAERPSLASDERLAQQLIRDALIHSREAEEAALRVQSTLPSLFKTQLEMSAAPAAFCSVLTVADVMFAEAALEKCIELNLVLPFTKAAVWEHLVAVGAQKYLPNLITRLNTIFERAVVHYTALERGTNHSVIFAHTRRVLMGLSMISSRGLVASLPHVLMALRSFHNDHTLIEDERAYARAIVPTANRLAETGYVDTRLPFRRNAKPIYHYMANNDADVDGGMSEATAHSHWCKLQWETLRSQTAGTESADEQRYDAMEPNATAQSKFSSDLPMPVSILPPMQHGNPRDPLPPNANAFAWLETTSAGADFAVTWINAQRAKFFWGCIAKLVRTGKFVLLAKARSLEALRARVEVIEQLLEADNPMTGSAQPSPTPGQSLSSPRKPEPLSAVASPDKQGSRYEAYLEELKSLAKRASLRRLSPYQIPEEEASRDLGYLREADAGDEGEESSHLRLGLPPQGANESGAISMKAEHLESSPEAMGKSYARQVLSQITSEYGRALSSVRAAWIDSMRFKARGILIPGELPMRVPAAYRALAQRRSALASIPQEAAAASLGLDSNVALDPAAWAEARRGDQSGIDAVKSVADALSGLLSPIAANYAQNQESECSPSLSPPEPSDQQSPGEVGVKGPVTMPQSILEKKFKAELTRKVVDRWRAQMEIPSSTRGLPWYVRRLNVPRVLHPGGFVRLVRTMMFADVRGYSKLQDVQTPLFCTQFLGIVDQLIRTNRPEFANTWGDGLFLVFESPVKAASFAVAFLHQMELTPWEERGLPKDTTVRVGLHTGPVYFGFDAVTRKYNYFGRHVTVADKIEPVTTPGCVWGSGSFAASLATADTPEAKSFVIEYTGSIHIEAMLNDPFDDEPRPQARRRKRNAPASSDAQVGDSALSQGGGDPNEDGNEDDEDDDSDDDDDEANLSTAERLERRRRQFSGPLAFTEKDLEDLSRFDMYNISSLRRQAFLEARDREVQKLRKRLQEESEMKEKRKQYKEMLLKKNVLLDRKSQLRPVGSSKVPELQPPSQPLPHGSQPPHTLPQSLLRGIQTHELVYRRGGSNVLMKPSAAGHLDTNDASKRHESEPLPHTLPPLREANVGPQAPAETSAQKLSMQRRRSSVVGASLLQRPSAHPGSQESVAGSRPPSSRPDLSRPASRISLIHRTGSTTGMHHSASSSSLTGEKLTSAEVAKLPAHMLVRRASAASPLHSPPTLLAPHSLLSYSSAAPVTPRTSSQPLAVPLSRGATPAPLSRSTTPLPAANDPNVASSVSNPSALLESPSTKQELDIAILEARARLDAEYLEAEKFDLGDTGSTN